MANSAGSRGRRRGRSFLYISSPALPKECLESRVATAALDRPTVDFLVLVGRPFFFATPSLSFIRALLSPVFSLPSINTACFRERGERLGEEVLTKGGIEMRTKFCGDLYTGILTSCAYSAFSYFLGVRVILCS